MRSQGPMAKGLRTSGLVFCGGLLFSMLLTLLLTAFPRAAMAAESSSLTIVLTNTHEGKTVTIEGVTAEVYQVARFDDNLQNYEMAEPFSSLDVDFNQDYTFETMWLFAKQAAATAKKDGLTGISRTSGADGVLRFGLLENGIYLVRETGAVGAAAAYREFDPFLISVPQIDHGQVTYDVISYPKVPLKSHGGTDGLDPEPDKGSDPNKEPDESNQPDDNVDTVPTPVPVNPPRVNPIATVIPWIPIDGTIRTWPWVADDPVYPWRSYPGDPETSPRMSPDTAAAIQDLVSPPSQNASAATTPASVGQPNATEASVSPTNVVASRTATTIPVAASPSSGGLATTGDDTSWIPFQILAVGGSALAAVSAVVRRRCGSRNHMGE